MSSDPQSPDHRQPRRKRHVRTGIVTGMLALAVLAVGAAIVATNARQKDTDGFYTTEARTVTTPTYAFASDGLDVGTDVPDWFTRKGRLGTISVTATGTSARPVFVGIAATSEVRRYLDSVEHEEITDFDVDPFTVTSARRPGSARPLPPTDQRFWVRSASGTGEQTLTWPVQEGSWNVVVMNADGTRGVSTSLRAGAKVPAVRALGRVAVLVDGLLADR